MTTDGEEADRNDGRKTLFGESPDEAAACDRMPWWKLRNCLDFINVGFIPVILNAFPARLARLLSHIASHAHHQTGSHAS